MDDARWEQVETLFERASDLEPEEQRAYLKSACEGDDTLLQYLSKLLRISDDPSDRVEGVIATTVHQAFVDGDEDAADLKGSMIGPYCVERLIGSGGMGMVYLAARADEQFEQQVAIKLGRHRLVDPDTVLRLRNERQILANLDHPNIAKLFDGGTTQNGVPYLVMEYIDGVRIDTYCDVNRLGITERLRLFQAICSAVHYAHQNLVIHRDIKATNILVTADGTPKLLDFGIAKLIDSAGKQTDGLTREGAVILTPANATPEQVLSQPVTTATDTYALGLLLNVLLTGYRAFDTDGMSPSEFASTVVGQFAVRPSVRVQDELQSAETGLPDGRAETLQQAADNRQLTSTKLIRRLRGDLDTIVLKALRKEPERRYRSVNAMADDVDLHLKSMPIVARSESWRYRSAKFIRRHYAAVAASLAAVAMLVTFSIVVSLQNRSIAKERDTAREVSKFLEEIFNKQDPREALGGDITAQDLLESGEDRIREDLDDRPEIQSALMGTIGRVYYTLGDFQSSSLLLEEALKLQTDLYGADYPDNAIIQNDLAATLIERADYSRAEELLESALATNQKNDEAPEDEIAENVSNLANLYLRSGDIEAAEKNTELSINEYRQLFDNAVSRLAAESTKDDIETANDYAIRLASAKATMARIRQVQGDLDSTERLLREAIDIVATQQEENHPSMAFYMQNLGVLLRTKGDLPAASQTLAEAITLIRHVLGEKHDLYAATLVEQGIVLHQTGDLDNAEIAMLEALEFYRNSRGEAHPTIGYTLIVLGMLQHDKRDLTVAEKTLRDSLEIFEAAYDRDHQYTASSLTELGAVLNSADRSDEAEPYLQRALEIRNKDYEPNHDLVAATRVEYADALTRQGRYEEALPLLQQSYQSLERSTGRRQQRAAKAMARFYSLSGIESTTE